MSFPNIIGHYRDGLYRRAVESIKSTAARTIEIEESGMVFFIPGAVTGQIITLPKISSKWLGLEYSFHVSTQASSANFKINCVLDSSASIFMNLSSIVDNHSSIIPGTTQATAITLTAVSSVVWMGQPLSHNSYSGSSDATSNCGGWTTG